MRWEFCPQPETPINESMCILAILKATRYQYRYRLISDEIDHLKDKNRRFKIAPSQYEMQGKFAMKDTDGYYFGSQWPIRGT
jgi:hypothetical protein